jgi:hypothetical protein
MNYNVTYLPIGNIKPSPENDDLYGVITLDASMESLIESILRHGLSNPILLTRDGYILSGHRRFFACQQINMEEVPCMITMNVSRAGNEDFHRDLADFNTNRVKGVGTMLKEALIQQAKTSSTYALAVAKREQAQEIAVEYMPPVQGIKTFTKTSQGRMPFLNAAIKVINEMKAYWPLQLRQIHYKLLNNPPLKLSPKRTTLAVESRRYKNDLASYSALSDLLKNARYEGLVPMHVIDDPTRISETWNVYHSVHDFVAEQTQNFLTGFVMDAQFEQPNHIEVLGEKNTLINIIRPVCMKYHVPLSIARGFGSVPCLNKIKKRFEESGKERLVVIVISDLDPEGLELADDAIRTLRDVHGLPVEYLRVGVTLEQVENLGLAEDFNPAKTESSNLERFIEKTGSSRTWECEALPPEFIRETLDAAILSAMDTNILNRTREIEEQFCDEIDEIKERFVGELGQ